MRQLLLALSVVCAGFASAPGVAAQALSAEVFARDPAITSISLSPNGQYVAMIQRVGQDEALAIVDWRAGEARGIQVARRSDGQFLDWVRWKNDGRLLFSMHRRLHWDGTPEDRSWEVLRRVFAVDRSGANVTQMFEGQMRRLAAADYAPISLVDIMLNDPDEVVLGTWGQNGYTLYRANVNTGRADVIDDDSGWETVEMMVDGAGNAVMRTQWLPNNSGYQFFRRAPGERNWTLAHEVRRSTVAQNRAFDPLGPGPGAGQVYVAARPEGQEFQAIYLYDTRTGELGEPAYAHPNADAAVLRLDPNDNSMLAGCGETQRMQCRARDPLMQRHFRCDRRIFRWAG